MDFGSRRIETCICYVLQALELLEELQAWKGLQSLVIIHAKEDLADKIEAVSRFYLNSKKETPAYLQYQRALSHRKSTSLALIPEF